MKTQRSLLFALAALLASVTYAQPTPTRVPPKFTVATAPSCVDGEPRIYSVTNAASTASCEIAASPGVEVFCQCLDGVRSVLAGGGAGGNSFETINTPAGTDPVAESATDTLNITCSGGLACTGTEATDTLDITMGTATAASALAANGANCSASQYPLGVDASGAAESCTADDDLPDADEVTEAMLKAVNGATDEYLLTYESTTGDFEWVQHAPTASALAANGADCSAGNYPLGVDASGASESCTADDDTPDSDGEVPDAITVTGAVSPSTFTFPASAAPAQTTDAQAIWDSDDNRLTVGDGVSTLVIYPGAHAGAVSDGGAATTATALAANGGNCTVGNYPLGVDASGAVESCTADSTTPASDAVTEAMLKAVDAASDEECLTYESTVGDFEWQSCGTGIGGSTGATDDAILIADGVGGATLAASAATLTAAGSLTIPSGQTMNAAAGAYNAPSLTIGGSTLGLYSFNNVNNFVGVTTGVNTQNWFFTGGMVTDPTSSYTWASATLSPHSRDTGLARNAAGVVRATNGSSGIRGFLGGGAAVASATALPVPTGRVFHVTGTTTVTSITSTNFGSGACVTLIFDDILTFTDGSNLKLAGDFVTTADDTISLCYDGTSWHETSRSVN